MSTGGCSIIVGAHRRVGHDISRKHTTVTRLRQAVNAILFYFVKAATS
jgi:hypothetical protein